MTSRWDSGWTESSRPALPIENPARRHGKTALNADQADNSLPAIPQAGPRRASDPTKPAHQATRLKQSAIAIRSSIANIHPAVTDTPISPPNERTLARRFFHELIWPAVAAIVIWALFTLLLGNDWLAPGIAARAITILLLGTYLSLHWIRENTPRTGDLGTSLRADAVRALVIVILAVAARQNDGLQTRYLLMLLFFATALVQFLGIGKAPKAGGSDTLGLFSALALILLFTSEGLAPGGHEMIVPIAMLLVFVPWLAIGKPLAALRERVG